LALEKRLEGNNPKTINFTRLISEWRIVKRKETTDVEFTREA